MPSEPCGAGVTARREAASSTTSAASPARPEVSAENIAELRAYLRRGLRKTLAGRRVHDDDIDDFTHDAIVRILRDQASFRGESRFSTWAMAVAIRVAFGALRRRRYREQPPDIDTRPVDAASMDSGWADDPARCSARNDLVNVLYQAISETLTDRQRTAILGELKGVPSDVLAERLGMTRNAFYKLHHDARKKLKSSIIAAGFTEEDVIGELL
jgi:RNA polymerase sigma factor (sigma-70 family)